jgi:Bacterial regulatory helix-turn-helix protein, lysR family
MDLAAASEMSLGCRVDKQPTWHPIWRARYRVAVDCRPEVPFPRSTDRLLPGFVETFCGAGLRPGPAMRTRQRGTIRRFLRLSSHLGGLTLIPTRRPIGRILPYSCIQVGRRKSDLLRSEEWGMDRLTAMDAFIRVVDAGSFSSAATQLRMGQSAVSKSIAQLEERLSVRLLLRTTRFRRSAARGRPRGEWAKVPPEPSFPGKAVVRPVG